MFLGAPEPLIKIEQYVYKITSLPNPNLLEDKINSAIIFLGQDINKLFKDYNKDFSNNNSKSQLNNNIDSLKTLNKDVKSSGQCTATTQKGARCSRQSRSNGFCWQHGG